MPLTIDLDSTPQAQRIARHLCPLVGIDPDKVPVTAMTIDDDGYITVTVAPEITDPPPPATVQPAHREAFIWAHPDRMSGSPCIGGNRVDVNTVVGMSLADAIDGYGLTAEEYHLAWWFSECFTYTYSSEANEAFRQATKEPT